MDRDEYLPGLSQLADAVHAHATPIFAELMVGFGRMGKPTPNRPNISASPNGVVIPENRFPRGLIVPGGRTTPKATEATRADILQLQEETVAAAARAQKAGWDGVEIAAHMSYFTASFLSPRTNSRTGSGRRALGGTGGRLGAYAPWHFLYFLPLPHQQGSLRPTRGA